VVFSRAVEEIESFAGAVFQLVERRPAKLSAGYSEVRARFDSEGAMMANTSVDYDLVALHGRSFSESFTMLLDEGVFRGSSLITSSPPLWTID
jgi:hypothetical protein